jgi:hypothetical protein
MTRHAFLSGATLDMVVFHAGHYRYAVEARQVRASRPLAGHGEIPALESLLGLPEAEPEAEPEAGPERVGYTAARLMLLMRHPDGDFPLSVRAPLQMQAMATSAIHPLPPLLAARTRIRGLRALALEAEGATLLVDILSLLDAAPGREGNS